MLKKIRAKISRSRADSDADDAGSIHTTPSNNEGNAGAVAGPKDLWQVAFDGLDPKHKPWLSQDKQTPLEVLQEVIDETEKKYTEYKKKQLTIRRRDGGEIKVREVAQKILASALNVQDVIKAIATFDPTGHASSAWAIVSLGLTMIKTNIERRDSILEASEYLADKLAYFTVIDSDRRYTKGAGDKQLEKALVKIYGAILEYAAEVRKTHSESLTARIGNTLIPLTEQPLQKLRKAVDDKSIVTEKWAAVTNWSYLKGQAEKLLTAIEKNVEELQKVHSVVLSAEETKILEWLSRSDFSNAQRNAQDHRSPGTGDWFLKLADYKEWKACPGNLFWLQGVAGCGKSVICSTIIEDIDRICRDHPKKRLAYWYFQFSVLESQRVENMLRGIIRQLHSNPLDEAIRSIWSDHGTKGSHPSNARLLETLHGVINTYQGDVFLILDALDECPESPDRRARGLLLSLLIELQREHSNKLHILVTGRPEPDITEKLGEYTVLDLEECQGSDISTFVRLKVGSLDARVAPDEVKTQIIDELLQNEKRRFRWADLQIKRLEECRVKAEVLEALRTMPKTLEDIYLAVIDKISLRPSDITFAKSILAWLSFSVRPLTLGEVTEAAGLEVPEDVIRICTSSFVTFQHSENKIKLSHFSVKEFLVDIKRTGQWYQLSSLSCHAMIAEHTLQLLLQQTERLCVTDAEDAEKSGLLGYAARKWHEHFNASAVIPSSSKLQGMVDDLFRQPTVYRNWRRFIPELGEQEIQSAPISVASKLGLFEVVKGLLEGGVDPLEYEVEDIWRLREYRKDPLCVASASGNLDVLDLLLSNLKCCMRSGTAGAILQNLNRHGLASKTLEDIVDKLSLSGVIYARPTDQNRELQINEEIMIAVAGNENCGFKLMVIFLDQFEAAAMARVPVTESVLRAVLHNRGCGHDILQLLLERRPADVHINTEELREMMARSSSQVNGRAIELFLEARYTDIDIDEQFIATFATYANATDMRTFWSKLSTETFLTEDILSKAASNGVGAGAMRQILQQKNRAPVSRHILYSAASLHGSHRVEMMEALLDEVGPNFPLDIQFMSLVLGNWANAAEILNMLLHRQQAGFIVTYEVLYEAACYQNRDVFEILMNNGGLEIPITEDIMIRALNSVNHNGDLRLAPFLLDLTERSQIHPPLITDEVLLIALRYTEPDTLRTILQRRPISQVSNDMFVASCVNRSPEALLLLLKLPYRELPIVEIMQELKDNHDLEGEETTAKIQGLLNEMAIEIDQEHLEMFADRPHTLEFLLQRRPSLCITEEVVFKAAEGRDALRILLDERMEDIPMSEDAIVSIAKSACDGQISSLRRIITHFGSRIPITERVLIAASDTFEVLQLFLEVLGPKVTFPLSDEVVAFVTYQDLSALSWLLKRRGSAVPLTEKAMVIVAGNHYGVKWLLRERPVDVDLNNLWKAIWKFNFDDVLFDCLSSPKSELTREKLPQIQKRAATNILRCTREIDLSEEVFAQTSNTVIFYHHSGLLPLIDVCIEERLPVPATEQFMRVMLDRCGIDLLEAIRLVLQQFRSLPDHDPGEFEQMLWSHICERCGYKEAWESEESVSISDSEW